MEALAVCTVLAVVTAAAERGVALDARVETSSGAATQLATRWGRPTVLFYEDRHSTGLNQALKAELFARGVQEGLLDRVSVVAVANLEGLNWFPAREFALAGVRDAEQRAGIPVLVDWSGALSRPPWRLSGRTSSVLVLDGQGRVAFEASGSLGPLERQALLAALSRLVEAQGPVGTPRGSAGP
jgi:hypothetical protein